MRIRQFVMRQIAAAAQVDKDNPGLVNKPKWQIPAPPRELEWQAEGAARRVVTRIGTRVQVQARLGEPIRVLLTIQFYHALPRMDLTYEFDFLNACVGVFYLDETKLGVGWQLGFQGEIWHDIPFGVVKTEPELPVLPTRWIDVSDGSKGLAYFHQGTFKHWVKENTLFNLFAWGEETNAIGDRFWRENWAKSFDQRLNGRHTIHAALYPHPGDWRTADVIGAAQSYNTPPLAFVAERHPGDLPSQLNLFALQARELAPTGVHVQDSQVRCRFYSVAQQPLIPTSSLARLVFSSLQTLDGQPALEIQPFKSFRREPSPKARSQSVGEGCTRFC